jgi:uncharacterized membrane protein
VDRVRPARDRVPVDDDLAIADRPRHQLRQARRRAGGFVDSHHGWLIRTFWYGLLWYTLSFVVLLSSAWPVIHAVLRNPTASGEWVFAWNTIFSMMGTAALGIAGVAVTWVWLLYRLIRGSIQLANLRPVP